MNILARTDNMKLQSFPALLPIDDYPILTPVQQRALDKLETLTRVAPLLGLGGPDGSGLSTILRAFSRRHGGRIITLKEMAAATLLSDARLSDSVVAEYLEHVLEDHDLILLDDTWDLGNAAFAAVRGDPNQSMGGAAFGHLYSRIKQSGKRLVFASGYGVANARGISGVDLDAFTADDYAVIASNLLGADRTRGIDFKLVFRYASLLNGHELRTACQLVSHLDAPDTEAFVDALEKHVLASNIRVQEVEALTFDSLPGAEHITSKLETHVVLPLEHRKLAQELDLKPKRGVLLYGPPGTGKTSIGRALAHRMKGKFFLIDGSIVTEPPGPFFAKLAQVIREAKESAPSVLFIDDADVLFDIVHISGLARYLLTLLDGLQSESASHICVMMTAMDVRKVPEALLRSGRVELWLETRAPVGADRGRVLQRWLGKDMPGYDEVDYAALSEVTEGFTPADLRRITGDAKCLYAADHLRGKPVRGAHGYLAQAVDNLIATRERMAEALDDDRLRIGGNRKREKYGMGVGGMAEMNVSCKTNGWQ